MTIEDWSEEDEAKFTSYQADWLRPEDIADPQIRDRYAKWLSKHIDSDPRWLNDPGPICDGDWEAAERLAFEHYKRIGRKPEDLTVEARERYLKWLMEYPWKK